MRFVASVWAFLLAGLPLSATEISTGFLLGPRFDQRAFYIRGNSSEAWRKTYSDSPYRRQAQGKLMNLRLAQGLFHDEWLTEKPFDPDKNTADLIGALDLYKSHGVLMINVSLQGGQAGYSREINGVDRANGHKYGPEKGTAVSAWKADGALKPEWMSRLDRLLRAADQRGMVVNLLYFYQGQDEQFESGDSIYAATRNLTDWLIDKNFRNVIIDVANEWDLRGERWDFAGFIPQNIIGLIEAVRERFQKRRADFALPVSVSSDGRMNYPSSMTEIVDFVLIHGNGRSVEEKRRRLDELKNVSRPVLMNEDDNGRAPTPANLERELASCTLLFEKGAGWGYMPYVQAQQFPFRYLPSETEQEGSEMAYFHAVLDHIAKLTVTRPPHDGRR